MRKRETGNTVQVRIQGEVLLYLPDVEIRKKKVEKLHSRGRDWTKRNIVTERKFVGQNDTDIIFKVLKFCVVTGLGAL